MSRDYANIMVTIWGHPDVRALPPAQQWLYLQLWTHPDLSYAGVLDWRPGKNVAPLSAGSTSASVEALIPLLIERRFVIIDRDTEELYLRPYFRWDGVLKQRTLGASVAKAYASTGSNRIRAAMVSELKKLKKESPEWKAWEVTSLLEILKHPATEPAIDPAVEGRPEAQAEGAIEGQPTSTTTSTTTASPARRAETRLSDDWSPTAAHITRAQETGIDLMKEVTNFRLHAQTHDRHAANWNAAFTTWLSKAKSTPRKISPDQEWKMR